MSVRDHRIHAQLVEPVGKDAEPLNCVENHKDVALVRGPITDTSIRCRVVDNERRLAVVPADHRLAGRTQVSLADLSVETLIINSIAGSTTLDLWPPDEPPATVIDVGNIDEWLTAIGSGQALGITPASDGQR